MSNQSHIDERSIQHYFIILFFLQRNNDYATKYEIYSYFDEMKINEITNHKDIKIAIKQTLTTCSIKSDGSNVKAATKHKKIGMYLYEKNIGRPATYRINPELVDNYFLSHELLEYLYQDISLKYDNINRIKNMLNTIDISTTYAKQKIYLRNPVVKEIALNRDDYKCVVDREHVTFTSRSNLKPYVEGHHLIMMKCQEEFDNQNLDVEDNIVSLCPICHAKVHYGIDSERRNILKNLYNNNSFVKKIYTTFDNFFDGIYKSE